ncbi:MAG: PQQ-dependent sugar dehydrogenase [Myxococcota bacterium]
MTKSHALGGAGLCLVLFLFSACSILPEEYAVNAPMFHQMLGWGGGEAPPDESFGAQIVPAAGFSMGTFAEGLNSVRFLRPLSGGALLASQPRAGTVWRLAPDSNGDGRSDEVRPLLEDLDRPHGLDVHDGWLYVAEGAAIGRIRIDAETGETSGAYTRIVEGLPDGENHWTKTARIGPDGLLYVTVGSTCNVCIEEDERRAAMLRFQPDGSEPEIFARGLRNSVGFDWQPGTGALYATDNGRDLLGDDFPPCELNRVEEGQFYGWPFANGDNVPDPDFGAGQDERIATSVPPVHGFPAHNAPLGITFLRHPSLPDAWQGAALVALHGSWNRTSKDGYKVVSLHWGADGSIEQRDFIVGFEQDENVLGRPVDVAEGADGTVYVSDDYAGAIYWLKHDGSAAGGVAPAARASSSTTPAKAGDATAGAALWERHACASCHVGEAATAGVVIVPLQTLGDRYTPATLADFLAAPTPPMPAFPLDTTERADLAAHLLRRFP